MNGVEMKRGKSIPKTVPSPLVEQRRIDHGMTDRTEADREYQTTTTKPNASGSWTKNLLTEICMSWIRKMVELGFDVLIVD